MLLRIAATLWCALLLLALPASADNFRLLVLDGSFVKWGEPVLGAGAEVTYAFASEDVATPNARNCKRMAPFAGIASASRLPLDALETEARAAFSTWEKVSNLRFRLVEDQRSAEVVIGVEAEPTGLA